MKSHLNIVLLNININVGLKELQERLDLNKYFTMIIGIFGNILSPILRVMFCLKTMKVNTNLNLHGAERFYQRITGREE